MKTSKIWYLPDRYAITISPNDCHQFFGKPNRLNRCKSFIHEQFIHLTNFNIHYTLYAELSEPRDNTISKNGPRIHFHGIIYFGNPKAVRQFLLYEWYLLSRYSKFKIDTINDIKVWHAYCIKQQMVMNTHIIYSGLELFNIERPREELEDPRRGLND